MKNVSNPRRNNRNLRDRESLTVSSVATSEEVKLAARRERLLNDASRPGLEIETVLHYRQLADLILIRLR